MGNDGGSIPGRAELVKERPKEQRAESDLIGRFRARFCALTKQRLRKPIAVCRLGYLYNYDNLIKLMMEKKMPTQFMHIRKVKDLKEINFKENPDVEGEFPFMCPISETVFNGRNKFLVLWTCGCVFSEKVLKDIKHKGHNCPICNEPYTKKDIVELGLSNEEIEMKKAKLLQEQEQARQELKNKKMHHQEHQSTIDTGDQVEKKVCTDQKKNGQKEDRMQKMMKNIMEKVGQSDDLYKDSESYTSLFHKQHKIGDQLFNRNVRFGLR